MMDLFDSCIPADGKLANEEASQDGQEVADVERHDRQHPDDSQHTLAQRSHDVHLQ